MCKELNTTTKDDFKWSSLPYPMDKPEKVRHPRLTSIKIQARKRSSSAGDPRESKTSSHLGLGKTERSSSLISLVTPKDASKDSTCSNCGGKKLEDSRILKGNNIQSFYAVWKIRDTGKKLVDKHRFDLPSTLTRNDSHRTCGCMTRTHQKHTDNMCFKPKYCACVEINVT